jgi:hypothetical protein
MKGKDRYQTVAYLSNHIIQPLFKKFNRKASICQKCFSMFHYSLGYRTPAEVAYGNGIKNSEVVL